MGDSTLTLIRRCQDRVPCHVAGGAALSGAHLAHRLSDDVDLFCHDADEVRQLVRQLPEIAAGVGLASAILRDSGTFVRATVGALTLDIVHEAMPDLEAPEITEDGITIESYVDLRAAKLTCLLSRAEPRDLADVLFLERAGHRLEDDLPHALKKDGGMDPGVLAWLLRSFPTSPLPRMLVPLTTDELRTFRDGLAERCRIASGA